MRNSIQDLRRRLIRRSSKLRGPRQQVWCGVVSEHVIATLRRTPAGFGAARKANPNGYFVQCNQTECQYHELNRAPCPLHVGLFDRSADTADQRRAVG